MPGWGVGCPGARGVEPEGTGARGAGLSARVQLLEDYSWEFGKHGKAWCLMRALEETIATEN